MRSYITFILFFFPFFHLDMRSKPSPVPPIEVQCRVIKRWPHLSSLLVEVLPWCLLVNNTAVHLIVRDLERDVTVDLSIGSVVAPHRITVENTYLELTNTLTK